MKANLHDQFLEGWAGVIPLGYSATGGIVATYFDRLTRVSLLELGLTVETKAKPNSRRDTHGRYSTWELYLHYLSSEEFDGLVDCSESDNAFSIALYNSPSVFVL